MTSPARNFSGFVHPRSAFPSFSGQLYPPHPEPKSVLVLGAGLAGLSAAYQLVNAGHDVTLLEAKPTPGGRVHTLREPFIQNQVAEAGAMFVPGHHTLTIGYVEMLGLPLLEITAQATDTISYLRGTRVGHPSAANAVWPVPLTQTEQANGALGLWTSYVIPAATGQLGDPRALGWPPEVLVKFDNQTFAEFLRSENASPGAIEILQGGYFGLFGDGMDAVCALDVLRDIALQLDGVPPHVKKGIFAASEVPAPVAESLRLAAGGTLDAAQAALLCFTIQGGNDQLPKGLAATPQLAHRIEYGIAIRRIEDTGNGVRVTSEGGRSWEAERAIVAIPYSVLREVEIRAPLTAAKRRVIAGLRATSVTRTFVQTSGRPWQQMGLPGTASTDLPIMYVNDQSISQPGPAGILESYSAGPRARAWAAMPLEARYAETIAQLDLVYPGVAGSVVATATKSWDEDEWARGDYCYFEPGEMRRYLPAIARPEGRLHFAGEHTSCMPGWMQGAFESGHRAAGEVHSA